MTAHFNTTGKWGTAITRLNFMERFSSKGWQPEIDLYPRISNRVHGYFNYGYSNSILFPNHRAGAEIYIRLINSMEGSLGLRYLYYNSVNKIPIYTGSLAWYFKNFMFSYRPYFSSVNSANSFSSLFMIRNYFKDRDNYIGLLSGFGFSPDDKRLQGNLGLSTEGIYILHSQRVAVTMQKSLARNLLINATFTLVRQELAFSKGNYIIISTPSIWLQKRF